MTRQQIVHGVAALKAEGLRVEGSVFIGAPYESEVSIDDTIDLLAKLDLDSLRARVYYPVPGTRSAEICAENGWISGRGEENFDANRSVLTCRRWRRSRLTIRPSAWRRWFAGGGQTLSGAGSAGCGSSRPDRCGSDAPNARPADPPESVDRGRGPTSSRRPGVTFLRPSPEIAGDFLRTFPLPCGRG